MSASLAPTIEEKDLAPSAAARVIARQMARAQRTTATAEDVVALTGLPLLPAGRGLMHLARLSPARLEVTEAGVLRFVFAGVPAMSPPLFARASASLRAAWTTHLAPVVEVFVWLVAGLVLVAAGSGLMSAFDGSPHRFGPVADVFEVIGAAVLVAGLVVGAPVFLLAIAAAAFVVAADEPAARVGRVAIAVPVVLVAVWWLAELLREWLARQWLGRQLCGFFLGTAGRVDGGPEEAGDVLADERKLVALLRARNGVVGLGDLAGTFGWDLDQTHRELPRILVDYEGSIVLDDDLHLALRFDRFAGDKAGEVPARATVSPPPGFFACAGWFAALALALVVATSVVGLARADAPLFPGPNQTALALIARRPTKLFLRIDDVANDGFGLWPLACAASPLAIRLVVHRRRLRQRDRRERLVRVLDFALDPRRRRSPAAGNAAGGLDVAAAERLGVVIDDGVWSFPVLECSQRAAASLRAARRRSSSSASSARVVFTA